MPENMNSGAGGSLGGTRVESATRSFFDSGDITALGEASDVLVLGPMQGSLDDHVCAALIDTWPVADRNMLFVSFTKTADERIALIRDSIDDSPEHICVVSGADRYPSETTAATPDGSTTISVEVADPSDLTRLGMTISRAVDEWGDGNDPLVCFHSLTALLQYVTPKRAFRFVHLLQNRLHATAHYHMDSIAHEQQTVATLRPLFDVIVEYDAEGNVTVTA